MNLPDIIAICVSSPYQARHAEAAVQRRRDAGIYPQELNLHVVHDPAAGRVGSGGGTIHALAQLRERVGNTVDAASVLLIHAGGESRRLPAYAPEGKLFAPVPVPSSTVLPPVLLDIQLALYLSYPWRPGELVVASGDVYLNFDVRSVRAERGALCGFAAPASFEHGSRHGVFVFDRTARRVTDYLQKAPVTQLRADAPLPGGRACALDIGIVAFHGPGRQRLRVAEQELGTRIAAAGLSIDLYTEILTAALTGITPEHYHRRIAAQSRLTTADQDHILDLFGGLDLTGVLVRDSTFLHAGSVPDLLHTADTLSSVQNGGSRGALPFYDVAARAGLAHELEPVSHGGLLCAHCANITSDLGASGYAEGCENLTVGPTAGPVLLVGLSGLDLTSVSIPAGLCLDGRFLSPAAGAATFVVALYHAQDSFKPAPSAGELRFCGLPLQHWATERDFSAKDLGLAGWAEAADLWDLPLFPADPSAPRLAGFWDVNRADNAWRSWFRSTPRFSLHGLNGAANPAEREEQRCRIRAREMRTRILNGQLWQSLPATDMPRVFQPADLPQLQALAAAAQDDLTAAYRSAALTALAGDNGAGVDIQIDYLSSLTTPPPLRRSVKPDQLVWARSPVRMDLAGGWTDTPPYTLREGGRVCNVAVDLNGQPPVQVFCRPMAEPQLRFHSIDLGLTEQITTFAQIADYRDPAGPFALPRAAAAILGLTAERHPGRTLAQVLQELGGGVEITLLAAVPKGSGLGTSSILGATLLAALERFFGVADANTLHTGELYRQVLQMEQMLTTGGGWQDQIGGVAGGVKYAVSEPGMRPELTIYQLDPWLFLAPNVTARYTLFYTGATRLAKNLLQEVVAGYNSMSPAYLFTVRRIAALAGQAREAFALRDPDLLAQVVAASWQQNRLMHPSTTNLEIAALLDAARPHTHAFKLLGAGGGGFAFFISPSADAAVRLRETLEHSAHAAGNTRARVVDLSLNQNGLQVTVS